MTRTEHLAWAKRRALEYVDQNDLSNAYASLLSDFLKHPQLGPHAEIVSGYLMLKSTELNTPHKMREFINGFN